MCSLMAVAGSTTDAMCGPVFRLNAWYGALGSEVSCSSVEARLDGTLFTGLDPPIQPVLWPALSWSQNDVESDAVASLAGNLLVPLVAEPRPVGRYAQFANGAYRAPPVAPEAGGVGQVERGVAGLEVRGLGLGEQLTAGERPALGAAK